MAQLAARTADGDARGWNAWLAAEGRERAELWCCYVAALAEEEPAAAEVERMVTVGARADDQA